MVIRLSLGSACGIAALTGLSACGRPAPTPRASPDPAPAPAAAVPPAPTAAAVRYTCDDGRIVVATYDRANASLQIGDRAARMTTARSASGARYVGDGLQWWTRGLEEGRLSRLKPGEDLASDPGVACHLRPVEPPPPGAPGGLPDDRTPISEGAISTDSAQGAAQVAQNYYAALEHGDYASAWRLWGDDGRASGRSSAEAFARTFDRYASYHAQIGAPGDIEGAAGSLYVSVPVVIYGRLKSGGEVHESGAIDLRRVNEVPGSTAEQRRWRISRVETRPQPTPGSASRAPPLHGPAAGHP